MKREILESSLTDGTRRLGMVKPQDGQFEAHTEDGRYLGKYLTVSAAREALIRADRERDK